ncbi:MAG TPA: glycosyltransferase family 39 protein [Herpetosiphonaceae bacterium]
MTDKQLRFMQRSFARFASIDDEQQLSPAVVDTASIQELLLLAVALGAGAFLRSYGLNSMGLNTDEAVYSGQAAAIVGDPTLKPFFPMFRAHPILFQFIVSFGFLWGVNDLVGRMFAVAFGLATLLLVYHLGKLLYGRWVGAIAALFLALMPYHVVVTRQMLLDGPLTFCTTLTLYMVARFGSTQRPAWMYAAGSGLALTFLTKETGVIIIGAIYAFLALCPQLRLRIRDIVISMGCMVAIVATFPLSLALAGGGGAKKTQSYLVWQLFRRPNHEWTFYPSTVPFAIGPLLIIAAIFGLWLLRRQRGWREVLLAWWAVVPVAFFQLWPTKGFQYLLPIAPALAVLAGRALIGQSGHAASHGGRSLVRWLRPIATAAIAISLLLPSWSRIQPATSDTFLAGSGGIPGGREAGRWISEHVPEGAQLLTIGPSMANVLQFYGHRKAYGLSVSPNPLHRNPSYEPIPNPDMHIRSGELQYLVWDSFSAARSSFFSEKILRYASRYHGRIVHSQSVTVTGANGERTTKPIIIIYEVRP